MKKIELSRFQPPGRDPVQGVLLRSVVILAFQKGEEPHGMPAKAFNEGGWDFVLPVVVSQGPAQKTSAIRGAQRFKRVAIQTAAANPGGY